MKNLPYLVVGLGKTGQSIARYLRRNHLDFMVFDTRSKVAGIEAFTEEFPEVEIYLENFPVEKIASLQAIITSPGVSQELPLFTAASSANIPVYGDIECFAREVDAPVVAITGTNGKSTVTTLVGEMAREAGLKAAVAGNIGTPVLDLLAESTHYDLWVLELSSFQLDLTQSLSPLVATILNISPDHLDRHHTQEAYTAAKHRIYLNANSILYSRNDRATEPVLAKNAGSHPKCMSFGMDAPQEGQWGLINTDEGPCLARGQQALFPVSKLKIKGVHNWVNALAAYALADAAHIPHQVIIRVLERFSGLPHRCQWVRNIHEVTWINDSKGTNIGATISAIEGIGGAMQGKIVLIAGGQGKGADFNELKPAIEGFVRSVVLIGEDADLIEAAIEKSVPTHRADTMEAAVNVAKAQAQPGDVVLLSPACASLDMFNDFNHRGEVFTQLVQGLN